MTTVTKQIGSANEAICRNIEALSDQRALLSQNVLSHLRNMVEAIVVLLHTGSPDAEFSYDTIDPAIQFVRGRAKLSFLAKFHKLIQKSASHYTLDGDASERLMLKYYEYLHRIRSLLRDNCEIVALENLEKFPVDLDPSLREYHEKIAEKIEAISSSGLENTTRNRYYIHRTCPFFVGQHIYYEVTFYRAVNVISKFDRIIAFTHIDLTDKYSAMLTLQRDSIDVLDQTMPITIIRNWEVSIRPCEFNNFARILGFNIKASIRSLEYRYLMKRLTKFSGSLLDIIDMSNAQYEVIKDAGIEGVSKPIIFPILDDVRRIVRSSTPGHNVIRYLLLRMHNQVIKPQYNGERCNLLSDLFLQFGCIPFDTMPFCSSPIAHNPRYWDLIESLDAKNRNHELLARRVRNNVERHGVLYTPVSDVEAFGDTNKLTSIYNSNIYYRHAGRRLLVDKGHVFIQEYEDNTVAILEKLGKYAESGIDGYTVAVNRWLKETYRGIDDEIKIDALKLLFNKSKVALIYGAAGTGKSTMVDHIAKYFNDKTKLFLAHTNPAKDNLQRKVTAQHSSFRTISSQIYQNRSPEYDLLVIDECSTVSNTDMLKVLERTRFKLLVLVGDVYQIESIQFGNWFSIIRSFIPKTSVFELTTPYRTKNRSLLTFWDKVRNNDDDIAEAMARYEYSTILDKSLFKPQGQDEIILCLNYDGLYGINNINRFLQASNHGAPNIWRDSTYKIGDPVLFNETERFRPLIYNNLKGWIVGINHELDKIQFDIQLDRSVSELDVNGEDLEWMGESTVRFSVYHSEMSDEDDDSLDSSVPFQVAYAVSIHKAQGLEYESVKIVITDANEDDISHNIFYTAVTRARKHLQIFWTPETQQNVLNGLRRNVNMKDVHILAKRRGLNSVTN